MLLITILFFWGTFHVINENIKNILIAVKNQAYFQDENTINQVVSDNIVVVAIDDTTYERFGFPMLKGEYGVVLDYLSESEAEIVGIDIIFANNNLLDEEGDDKFAESIKNAGNIVLGSARISKKFGDETVDVVEKPLEKFLSGALGFGYFQPVVDTKANIVTSFRPREDLPNEERKLLSYNHFVIVILKAYYSRFYDKNYLNYEYSDNNFYYIKPDYPIPFMDNAKQDVLINFLPLPDIDKNEISRFTTYSFEDVYDRKIGPEAFKGKIILIGATAKGIKDVFTTPNGEEFGVYVNANILNTILTKNFLIYFDWKLELLLIFLVILLSTYFNLSRSGTVLIVSNLLICSIFLLILPLSLLMHSSYLLNNLFDLFLAIVLSLAISNIAKYIVESRDKIKLNRALSEYVSESIADEILSSEGKVNLNGEVKNLAIYFSDIQDFTSISENMKAEELVAFLRDFLSEMSDIIMDEKGFINKYEGDGIMALWGVFSNLEEPSYNACCTALKQQKTLIKLNETWKRKGIPNIKMRIGIHFGEAIVGNIGSAGRKMEFTALGDNINLASRLEGINKYYGVYVCVSDEVYNKNKDYFEFRFLDKIRVKGKTAVIEIYELISIKGEISKIQKNNIEKFENAISLYREGNFADALIIFEELAFKGDLPSKTYFNRCNTLIKKAPAKNWDFVWNWDEK